MESLAPTLSFKPNAVILALKNISNSKGFELSEAELEDWSIETGKRFRTVCRHTAQLKRSLWDGRMGEPRAGSDLSAVPVHVCCISEWHSGR